MMSQDRVEISQTTRRTDLPPFSGPASGACPAPLDLRRPLRATRTLKNASQAKAAKRGNRRDFLFGAIVSLLIVLSLSAQALAQHVVPSSNGARDCAVCHLDWVDSFSKPGAILLIDKPLKPAVAEEDTCLGCHDGAIADDRSAVWLKHGHRTNVKPPGYMKVPDTLPLQDGKIACRTCHTAHANPDHEVLSNIIFLRTINDAGQLCQQCHTDKGRGPDHGTHPMGPMKLAMPDELLALGARAGADNKTLACQSCHRPHGASEDHLLVMGTQSSELCLSCHGRLRPEMWQKDVAHAHPLNPPLVTDARRKAVHDMGTYVGPNDTMICLSCHKLHKGQPGEHLLADTLTDSKLCLRCHEDRKTVGGSKHDLRKTAPLEKNTRGLTAVQSGQCGACHTFHTYTRQPLATAADPDGLCMTCHAPGKVAGKSGGTTFAHPVALAAKNLPPNVRLKLNPGHGDDKTLECLTCHNPHETQQPKFLRATRDELCGTCHLKQKQNLKNDHDFTQRPEAKNGRGLAAADTGKCGFCHDVHHANGPALWNATNVKPTTADDLCQQCHRTGGLGSKLPAFTYNHLTGAAATPKGAMATSLPLFDENAHRSATGFVSCASCHDPHADKQASKSLLRVGGTASDLCLNCHTEKQSLIAGPHDRDAARKPWPVAASAPSVVGSALADAMPGGVQAFSHRAGPSAKADPTSAAAPPVSQSSVGSASADAKRATGLASSPRAVASAKADPTRATQAPLVASAPVALNQTTCAQPALQPKASDPCMACHRPHSNDETNKRWAFTPAPDNVVNDGVCIACHKDRHWSGEGQMSLGNMIHPRLLTAGSAIAGAAKSSGLPLVYAPPAAIAPNTRPARPGPVALGPPTPVFAALWRDQHLAAAHPPEANAIACKTCHDPHMSRQASQRLLRVEPGKPAQDLCLNCHKDVAPLAHGMHRLDNPAIDVLIPTLARGGVGTTPDPATDALTMGPLPPRALSGPTCSPCHAVHAIETSDRPLLWAAPRSSQGATDADRRCLGCHSGNGAAKKPDIFKHPEAAFASLKYAVNQPVASDPATLFSCSTCHVQHGREIEGLAKLTQGPDGDKIIRAARPMVKDDVSRTVCATCHGADARRVFLYYHQPDKRGVVKELAATPQ